MVNSVGGVGMGTIVTDRDEEGLTNPQWLKTIILKYGPNHPDTFPVSTYEMTEEHYNCSLIF